jgi:hypothetical protein
MNSYSNWLIKVLINWCFHQYYNNNIVHWQLCRRENCNIFMPINFWQWIVAYLLRVAIGIFYMKIRPVIAKHKYTNNYSFHNLLNELLNRIYYCTHLYGYPFKYYFVNINQYFLKQYNRLKCVSVKKTISKSCTICTISFILFLILRILWW